MRVIRTRAGIELEPSEMSSEVAESPAGVVPAQINEENESIGEFVGFCEKN